MSFNPNTDANWALVVNAENTTNGAQDINYLKGIVQYLCLQATNAAGSINTAMITAAVAAGQYVAGTGAGNRNF